MMAGPNTPGAHGSGLSSSYGNEGIS